MKPIKQRNKIKFSTFILIEILAFNVVFMLLNLTILTTLIVGALSIFTMVIIFLLNFFDKYIESRVPKLFELINKTKEQHKEENLEKKLEILKLHINIRANKFVWSGVSLLALDLTILLFYGFLYAVFNAKIPQNFLLIILGGITLFFVPLFLFGYYLGKNLKELRKIQNIMIESIDKEKKLEEVNMDF